jgi:hypothetical protein
LKETIRYFTIDQYLKEKYGGGYRMLKQDFLQDFLFTLVIKIGAQDIQNDIITAQLILNETMEVNPEKKDVLEKVK